MISISRTPPPACSGKWCRFLRGFLDQPRNVASLVPSSRFLRRQLSSLPCVRSAGQLVELGPGTGETTEALLEQMRSDASLLCIEIVPQFVQHLREIPDPRLSVVEASAHDIETQLKRQGITNPDVIISGIPFSTMTCQEGRELVRKIHTLLAPGGTFVAYQLRNRVAELTIPVFGRPQRSLVLWNLPPLWIYQWKKSMTRSAGNRSTQQQLANAGRRSR